MKRLLRNLEESENTTLVDGESSVAGADPLQPRYEGNTSSGNYNTRNSSSEIDGLILHTHRQPEISTDNPQI